MLERAGVFLLPLTPDPASSPLSFASTKEREQKVEEGRKTSELQKKKDEDRKRIREEKARLTRAAAMQVLCRGAAVNRVRESYTSKLNQTWRRDLPVAHLKRLRLDWPVTPQHYRAQNVFDATTPHTEQKKNVQFLHVIKITP